MDETTEKKKHGFWWYFLWTMAISAAIRFVVIGIINSG
jgi:hypothetical protein